MLLSQLKLPSPWHGTSLSHQVRIHVSLLPTAVLTTHLLTPSVSHPHRPRPHEKPLLGGVLDLKGCRQGTICEEASFIAEKAREEDLGQLEALVRHGLSHRFNRKEARKLPLISSCKTLTDCLVQVGSAGIF
jgi:hypothetical protein